MKKIKDERLQVKNLKNIRFAFVMQTIGILAILGYDLISGGVDHMQSNPLWIVLMITLIVFMYLSMGLSVDYEQGQKSPKRGLKISLIVLTIAAIGLGTLVYFSEGTTGIDGMIFGAIIFVSGLAPILYIYHLRKKQQTE